MSITVSIHVPLHQLAMESASLAFGFHSQEIRSGFITDTHFSKTHIHMCAQNHSVAWLWNWPQPEISGNVWKQYVCRMYGRIVLVPINQRHARVLVHSTSSVARMVSRVILKPLTVAGYVGIIEGMNS